MSGEWAKSRKGYDRKIDRTRQKNKRAYIVKWNQTDSPEIPDRGGASNIPGLPSRGTERQTVRRQKRQVDKQTGRPAGRHADT